MGILLKILLGWLIVSLILAIVWSIIMGKWGN